MHAKKGGLSTSVAERNSMKISMPKEMEDFENDGPITHEIHNRMSQSLKGINSVSSDERSGVNEPNSPHSGSTNDSRYMKRTDSYKGLTGEMDATGAP